MRLSKTMNCCHLPFYKNIGHDLFELLNNKINLDYSALNVQVEFVYHHKYQTRKEAELSIFEYIETFYNKKRRHKKLNNLTILEYHKLINNNLKNAT